MSNTYFDFAKSTNLTPYQMGNSYIHKADESQAISNYLILPEAYDIFSAISNEFFVLSDTEQHRFLSLCLQYLKEQLLHLYVTLGIIRILPKLSISVDIDNAIILNWAYANFRIFFNFEQSVRDSFFGVATQSDEDHVSLNSGKLNEENYTTIIDTILKLVINFS